MLESILNNVTGLQPANLSKKDSDANAFLSVLQRSLRDILSTLPDGYFQKSNGGNSYCYVSNASYQKEIVLFFFLRFAYNKFVEHAIKTSIKIFLVFCLLLLLNKCKEIVFF